MENLDLLSSHEWSLSPWLGTVNPFFAIQTDIVLHTWIISAILIVIFVAMRCVLVYSDGLGSYAVLQAVNFFVTLCDQSLGFFSRKHISFIAALFIFIIACNTFSIIPGIEEPTSDLNTTLALGCIAFLYIQYESIKKNGLWPYVKSYFQPIFLLLPLNVIGKLASVISISFRLFGNIFGGALITQIYTAAIKSHWIVQAICVVCGINLLITGFFTLFEGALQAFVFTMLTLTYLTLATQDGGIDH
jgi:F-type H+-transporting ATPase subunit a